MSLHEQSVVLVIENLVGGDISTFQLSHLDTSVTLSKMKSFYKLKHKKVEFTFDILKYLIHFSKHRTSKLSLVFETLYLLNLRKKFSQKNMNRATDNYLKISLLNLQEKTNVSNFPENIIKDQNYWLTLSIATLYSISQFHNNETKIQISNDQSNL